MRISKPSLIVALLCLCAMDVRASGEKPDDASPQVGPTTFFVVRHAERLGKEDKLNEAGVKRALVLRDLMASQRIKAVYSSKTKRTENTVKPVADAAKLKILSYDPLPHPKPEWFKSLVRKHQGQSVLIVGHSNTVIPFVNSLGGKFKKKTLDHDEYHRLYIVQVFADGKTQVVRINFGAIPKGTTSGKAGDPGIMAPVRKKAGK